MLLDVQDANSYQQRVIAQGQESLRDSSGTLAATMVSQVAMQANPGRSGYKFQNCGLNPMYVNDLGQAAQGAGSFMIAPGAFFPPAGYGLSTNELNVCGTGGEAFTVREW